MSGTASPTAKQLAYLRQLAHRAGQTFTAPRTRGQASTEIRRLQQVRSSGFTFADLEAEEIAREAHYDAPLVRPVECTWSHRV